MVATTFEYKITDQKVDDQNITKSYYKFQVWVPYV